MKEKSRAHLKLSTGKFQSMQASTRDIQGYKAADPVNALQQLA